MLAVAFLKTNCFCKSISFFDSKVSFSIFSTNKLYYQPAGGGGGSQDLASVLATGNNAGGQNITNVGDINLATNSTLNFSSPLTAPTDWSINGVYNIDSGPLPFPVARFSAAKAGNTQQKSLTLQMTDGEAIWSSQWEGYLPMAIRTKQNTFTIDGQGIGASTNILCDTVQIQPNFASASVLTVSGAINATTVTANNLIYDVLGSSYINSTGTSTKTVSLNTTQPTNVFYVAKGGSDTSGNGTLLLPYLTVQKAITQAELVSSSSNPCTIWVNAGIYAESLSITKGYITISSIAQSAQSTGIVKINNAVTINCGGTDDLYGRQVNFYGITFGSSVTDNSSRQHTTIFENCYFSSTSRCLYVTNSLGATDCRIYVNNSIMSQTSASTNPAIEQTYGWLTLNNTYVTVDANVNCLLVSGTAFLIKCYLCQFEATHSGSAPIVSLTSTSSAPHSLGASSFVYTNGTGKVNGTSCGISVTRPNVTNIVVLQNFFSLTGISHPAGHAIQSQGASGTINIAFGSNIATPLYAYDIATTGVTKIPMQIVS